MSIRPTTPIPFLARSPTQLRNTLRKYGIALQTICLTDLEHDTHSASRCVILVDLRGYCLSQIAEILCQLRRIQRYRSIQPLLLIPPAALAIQRLVAATADLDAIILDPDDHDTIFMWALAPVDLIRTQLWVNVSQPACATAYPHLTELVAALGQAQSITQAAQMVALSPNATYHVLSAYLRIPSDIPIRRSISRWRALLSLQLCGAYGQVATLNAQRSVPDYWARNLGKIMIGAELQSIRWDGQLIQLRCHRPGDAQRHLMIEAKSTKPPGTTDTIEQLPCWARTIDWVDMVDTGICAIGLVGGSMIEVTSQKWQLECVRRWID